MTRRSNRNGTGPPCHVLNFFYDDENGCALTTLVHDYRFHIIADARQIKSESPEGQGIERQYKQLIRAVRSQDEEASDPEKFERREERDAAEVHGATDSQDSIDSGVGASDHDSASDDDRDSAIDVDQKEGKGQSTQKTSVGADKIASSVKFEDNDDPERALQNWMLAPFADIFAKLEPADDDDDDAQQSLSDWYGGPTYFYTLAIEDGELCAQEEESQEDLEQRIKDLVPHMTIPKYLRELDVPWRHWNDLTVVSASDEPDPYHPARVKVEGEVQFLKLVDTTQPQPIKRELKFLKDIERKGLRDKIRVPQVLGLVGYGDSKSEIMGFLLTDIEDPTPLTLMLDSDVIEDKRERWAKEVKRFVQVLHDNDIIWGDAKADNFMVDRHGDLWIIDFGGSYTDGWVDPELNETQEGDDMGTQRIVNALEDPESNTYDPSQGPTMETNETSDHKEGNSESRKRSREEDAREEGVNDGGSSKRVKSD